MSSKLYIIDISAEAAKSAAKQSYFKGTHFARYCLANIDEATNKMTTKVFTGDILSCLRNAIAHAGKVIELGNFKVKLFSNKQSMVIDTATIDMLNNSITDAYILGDGTNSLAKLFDNTHVVIANVIGQRDKHNIEYGCVICSKAGASKMTSWASLRKAIESGTIKVHNVRLSESGSFVRTNISVLGKVYLKIELDNVSVVKYVNEDAKQKKTKAKLLNQITQAKSALMYELTEEYELSALQYILKTHSQGESVHYMLNPRFTVEQLRALHKAYNNGIEIALIADPRISARSMEGIIKKFEYGLWECIDIDNLRK